MPNSLAARATTPTLIVYAVRLEFTPDSLVQINLSGAAFSGDWLWVAGDEACGIDPLDSNRRVLARVPIQHDAGSAPGARSWTVARRVGRCSTTRQGPCAGPGTAACSVTCCRTRAELPAPGMQPAL